MASLQLPGFSWFPHSPEKILVYIPGSAAVLSCQDLPGYLGHFRRSTEDGKPKPSGWLLGLSFAAQTSDIGPSL